MIEDSTIFQSPESDNFIITNKSCIEKKQTPTEEEKAQQDLHILYQLTNKNFPASKIKKDLNTLVENGQLTINGFLSTILGLGDKIDTNSGKDNLLYKNKVASFNRSLNSFRNKMNFIRENNRKTNDIINFLRRLKDEYDLILDEDFDININDTFLDIDKINLQYKLVKNFEELINMKDKNFQIYYTNQNKMGIDIDSNFYEYYSRYSLIFSLDIKINSYILEYTNDKFDDIFFHGEILSNKEADVDNTKKTIFLFYLKYLLYKFIKEEINAVKKCFSNSKASSFEYKGLTFTWKKVPRKSSFRCTYFDNLEIQFSISKNERKMKERKNIISCQKKEIMEYFKIFCQNITHDVKYNKTIINFIKNVKRAQNLTFDNLMKSTIFIKNLSKFALSTLKHELNRIVKEESKELDIIYSDILTPNYYFAKYQLYFDFLDKGNKMNYIINLYFDMNLNLTISIKEPYLNHIYILDSSTRYSVQKGKINFNILFSILKNLVPMLNNRDYKDISIRIMSIN